MLLHRVEHEASVITVAERLLQAMRQPFDLAGSTLRSSASIGVTTSVIGHVRPEDVLRDADIAMYRAKANGKDRNALFDSALHPEVTRRVQLEADLRRAIAEGHLSLVYQPLYRLHDSRLMGFEALSRWTHPEFGAIGPDVFIPIAEETGLIVQITEFVLNTASAELKQWQQLDADFAGLTMNVNISAKDLAHGGLVARIMRTLGVALCVDDFGTGYSLLAYLGTLLIDSLKIDRSFVMALQEKRQNVEIVRAVLALAKSLGRKVIAEGIETNDQLTLLRQMGVQEGQGYLLSRPLRPEQVSALLAPPPAPVRGVENAETALAGQPPPRWV